MITLHCTNEAQRDTAFSGYESDHSKHPADRLRVIEERVEVHVQKDDRFLDVLHSESRD